jgi:hypothetical protein
MDLGDCLSSVENVAEKAIPGFFSIFYHPIFQKGCDYPSRISLRMHTFLKPILGVEEYEVTSAFTLASGRFTVTP